MGNYIIRSRANMSLKGGFFTGQLIVSSCRKNFSGYKLKEMIGSGIFTNEPKGVSESDASTGLRYYQWLCVLGAGWRFAQSGKVGALHS
ncbi:hypothetical protein Bca101_059139 [Brassica carinata]